MRNYLHSNHSALRISVTLGQKRLKRWQINIERAVCRMDVSTNVRRHIGIICLNNDSQHGCLSSVSVSDK
jgi:hypothetical protein